MIKFCHLGRWFPLWAVGIVLSVLLLSLVFGFLTDRVEMRPGSMLPDIGRGDGLLVDHLSYWFRDPEPGDILLYSLEDGVYVESVQFGSIADIAGMKSENAGVAGVRIATLNGAHIYENHEECPAL